MSTYTLAEAEKNLPELIDRALKGEGVVITRAGAPVVEVRPVAQKWRRVTQDQLDWLEARRYRPEKPLSQTAAELVRAVRDED